MAGVGVVESPKGIDRQLLDDPSALQSVIERTLYAGCNGKPLYESVAHRGALFSTVMLLLGKHAVQNGREPEICFILNKRSQRVRQPGDLCCPGGTVETSLDPYLARLLRIPGFPLTRWRYWSCLREQKPSEARLMSLLLATGLREGWEEMRLNPFCTRFLGPLPSQRLLLFQRIIFPMVGWVFRQNHFIPSWEVERIVFVPLRSLLNPSRYACYRLCVPPHLEASFKGRSRDFACFLYPDENRTEVLWGVTYRIVTLFLELIFGFKPPDPASLPLVLGTLDERYINGHH